MAIRPVRRRVAPFVTRVTDRDLAALADGALAPRRRARVEAAVAASPELTRRLTAQRRVASLVRDAAARVEAPERLRAALAELRDGAGNPDRLPHP
jgi:anti-sigma factor RsiW